MKQLYEDQLIRLALQEDAVSQDITTRGLVPANHISRAFLVSRQPAILCGLGTFKKVFRRLDAAMTFRFACRDGDRVKKDTPVGMIRGKTRAILSAERVALNFLGHLSGIATLTGEFVSAARGSRVSIMDTRKTTPGMRWLEKEAVRCGGGKNHRMDLSAMVMIKDNHRVVHANRMTLPEAIARMRRLTRKPLEIEVDTLAQFKEALAAKPDVILLDNMSTAQIKKAVAFKRRCKSSCQLEVSGGVTLHHVKALAATGVNRISIGALTHSADSSNFSLDFKE